MKSIDELIMIIPVILNLKGNLEMNLSARLGTAANVGELDDAQTRRRIILGNLSLLQVQATVVSFVAACVALLLGLFVPQLMPAPEMSSPSNSSSATAPALHLLYPRRPRPPLPIKEGRPKTGFAEYVSYH
jgi:solute carrier family 41